MYTIDLCWIPTCMSLSWGFFVIYVSTVKLSALTKRLATNPSIAAPGSVWISLIKKHLTDTMELTIQPQGEEGGDRLGTRGTMGLSFSEWVWSSGNVDLDVMWVQVQGKKCARVCPEMTCFMHTSGTSLYLKGIGGFFFHEKLSKYFYFHENYLIIYIFHADSLKSNSFLVQVWSWRVTHLSCWISVTRRRC